MEIFKWVETIVKVISVFLHFLEWQPNFEGEERKENKYRKLRPVVPENKPSLLMLICVRLSLF